MKGLFLFRTLAFDFKFIFTPVFYFPDKKYPANLPLRTDHWDRFIFSPIYYFIFLKKVRLN